MSSQPPVTLTAPVLALGTFTGRDGPESDNPAKPLLLSDPQKWNKGIEYLLLC